MAEGIRLTFPASGNLYSHAMLFYNAAPVRIAVVMAGCPVALPFAYVEHLAIVGTKMNVGVKL